MTYSAIKRGFDIFFSGAALLVLLPFLVVLTIATTIALWGPPFFVQKRPGYKGKPFLLFKFRTMTDARQPDGALLPDSKRLSLFGRFMRKTSLDELPELVNVFKGEMSFVGPRPLLVHYLDRYTPTQRRRHDLKPGITGWAQVNGRNAVSWEQRFKMDVWYVDHLSFWLDLKIIAMTIWKIVRREGINQPGQATMEEFLG